MKSTIFTLFSACAILFAGCSQQTDEASSENTDVSNEVEDTAPDATSQQQQGYVLPGLDHGLSQSPINIISSSQGNERHSITLLFDDEINKVENLGHTVQLDFAEGSTIVQDDTTFAFKQCHFHTPSEHLVDGMTFPMEMHIVNIMPNEDSDATPQYLVIGVLFKEGSENKFIADFLDAIPEEVNGTAELEPATVKLADLFTQIPDEVTGDYYNYRGSLTTPPFTESVRWYIAKHIFEASAEQIEAINKIEGNNARHIQARYGRTVSSD